MAHTSSSLCCHWVLLLLCIQCVSLIQPLATVFEDETSGPDSMMNICDLLFPGGRAVIDGMQQHLALSDAAIEPSRAGLYRWGNVSSASVW
jgi:hypothetical protein